MSPADTNRGAAANPAVQGTNGTGFFRGDGQALLHERFRRFSAAAGFAAAAVGLAVLIGWALDIAALKSVLPGLVTMKANTALAFVLAGTALWLLRKPGRGMGRLQAARACAGVVAAIGALSLSEDLFGWDLAMDQLLFKEPAGTPKTTHPGRMAPLTAQNFFLLGTALWLLAHEEPRRVTAAQMLALAVGLVGIVAVLGYSYDVSALYGIGAYTPMALHTGGTFAILAAGVLCAFPGRGPMRLIGHVGPGGHVARRLLPAALLVPWLIGWLSLRGADAHAYTTAFGIALITLASFVAIGSLILWTAGVYDRTDEEHRLTRTLKVLTECGAALVRATDEALLIAEICRIVAEHGGYRLAWVGLVEDGPDKTVRPAGFGGAASGYLEGLRVTWDDSDDTGRGTVGTAIRSRHYAIARDLPDDPTFSQWRRRAREFGFGAQIVLPLAAEGRVFGVLSIFADSTDAFDERECAMLVELADDLAYGIGALRTRAAHEQAQRSLSESEDRFRRLTELSSDWYWEQDERFAFTFFSEAAWAQGGINPEEWIGRTRWEVPIELSDAQWAEHRARLEARRPFNDLEYRVRDRRGKLRWYCVNGEAMFGAQGAFKGYRGTAKDITERKRAEEALRASEAHYRAIAETTGDAIVSADQGGAIVAWNAAARSIFGYTEEEVLWRPLTIIMPERFREAHQRGLTRYLETGVPRIIGRTMELQGRHRDGTEFPVEISLSAWTSDGKNYFNGIIRDISQRKLYERELEQQANYDTLTGLANRNLLQDRIRQAIVHAGRSGRSVAVLLLDLDRLKLINDSLGHGVGDAVLRAVAGRLAGCVGEEDTAARLGGDEFVIVFPDLDREDEVSGLAKKLLDAVAGPMLIEQHDLSISGSIGISTFPKDGGDHETLLRNADAAMHRAKEQGRGRLQFYAQEMNARATERLRIQSSLARAMERREFRLHYQPVVDLVSGQVTGIEALLRWQTADGLLLLPADFIPVAEETGLISLIGEWALEQACRQARQWQERYDPDLRVAVNVSSVQIRDGTLPGVVRRALELSGLPSHALEIEITESYFLTQAESNRQTLEALKDLGVTFAIDDFGTHYAGLSFIRYFPVDRVKVDRSFIREIATHAGDAAISRAIISMAHGMGMKVTAEGLETENQLNYLRRLHCDEVQGNYFSPAIPAEEMEKQFSVPTRRFSVESPTRTLLLVDDEANVLASLKRALRREGYRILSSTSGREGLEMLATYNVSVILSDQRMPEMTGTEFLSRVKVMYPRVVRMVLSGHTDLATITDAINRGAVYKFLTKPWEDAVLRETLRGAFERYETAEVDGSRGT